MQQQEQADTDVQEQRARGAKRKSLEELSATGKRQQTSATEQQALHAQQPRAPQQAGQQLPSEEKAH